MTTRLAGHGDAVPAVQPGLTTGGRRATRRTRHGHRTAYLWERGLGAGRVARPPRAASSTSRRRTKGSTADEARRHGHLPALPPVGRGAKLEARRARATAPASTTSSSTRPARASRTRSPGSRTGSRRLHDAADDEGVRQGRRDHRPGRARPAAPGHDLPVRARARRRREDRQGLARSSPRRSRASRRGSSSRRSRSSRSSSTRSASCRRAATR